MVIQFGWTLTHLLLGAFIQQTNPEAESSKCGEQDGSLPNLIQTASAKNADYGYLNFT